MKSPLPRSITVRLYLAMLVTVAASHLVGITLLAVVPQLPGLVPSRAERVAAQSVALDLREYVTDLPRLQERVSQLSRSLDVNLVVLQGSTVLATAGDPMPLPRQGALDVAAGGLAVVRGGRVALLVPITGSAAALMISDRSITPVPIRGLLVLLSSILVAAVVLLPITRSITRPLAQLSRTVEAFGREPKTPRSGISTDDEVGRLARAFDAMAERIEQARGAERELIANVSHEIRTPIARVRMALALVDNGDPEVSRRIADVEEELRELQSLVERVLAAARLDAAVLPITWARVELTALLRHCRERFQAVSPAREVELRIPAPTYIRADRELLSRVFENLFENAHKYDPSGAPIAVEAETLRERVRITVRDRGPGIAEADRERVFQAFFRGADARAASASGFGIGLALARRIVSAHEGTIRIAGGGTGGTIVEIELPLATETLAA